MPRRGTNVSPVSFRRLQSNASDLATERPWCLVRGVDPYDSMSACRHDVTAFSITGRAAPSDAGRLGAPGELGSPNALLVIGNKKPPPSTGGRVARCTRVELMIRERKGMVYSDHRAARSSGLFGIGAAAY
jgi:hypothetical protein